MKFAVVGKIKLLIWAPIVVLLCLLPAHSELQQRPSLHGGVDYTETINDEHQVRVIDWNDWIDRFVLEADRRVINSRQFREMKRDPEANLGIIARFNIAIYPDGHLDIIDIACSDYGFNELARRAYQSLEYSKFTRFPEGTKRDRIAFNCGMVIEKHPTLRPTQGYNEVHL